MSALHGRASRILQAELDRALPSGLPCHRLKYLGCLFSSGLHGFKVRDALTSLAISDASTVPSRDELDGHLACLYGMSDQKI